jgi:multidrug transporter EmrE-like cation transporter
MNSAPNFWELFAEALKLSASKRSIRAFAPWWLIVCCVAPAASVYFLSASLRAQISDSNAITVLSAVAVVGAFFGSVSIATMGQVQRMASEYPFSSYLREEGVFDLFLFLASIRATLTTFSNFIFHMLGRTHPALGF